MSIHTPSNPLRHPSLRPPSPVWWFNEVLQPKCSPAEPLKSHKTITMSPDSQVTSQVGPGLWLSWIMQIHSQTLSLQGCALIRSVCNRDKGQVNVGMFSRLHPSLVRKKGVKREGWRGKMQLKYNNDDCFLTRGCEEQHIGKDGDVCGESFASFHEWVFP